MEIQHIKKWGNSAGVRIPASILREARLDIDAVVQIHSENGKIVMEAVPHDSLSLDALVAKITPENLHEEIDFGQPQGSEIW